MVFINLKGNIKMRYLLYEQEHPMASDYYYEATHTENEHFPNVPAHTHDFYEIYVFLNGSVKLAVEDKVYNVQRGDIMLIPPFSIHQLLPVELDAAYERIYMYITEPCLASFQFNEHSLLQPIRMAVREKRFHFHISNSADYESICNAMDGICNSKKSDHYGKELLNRSRILELVTLLNKHILLDIAPRKSTHINPVIDEILTYINEHYYETLSLDEIAERFFINKFTLTKLFKKQTALTIHNYILLKRISMAKQKMLDGMLPSKVFMEVGFSDYSTFYRAFLKSEKISPKEFAKFSIQSET